MGLISRPNFKPQELQKPMAAYRSGRDGRVQKWRAPRTHLHAEMVKRRPET